MSLGKRQKVNRRKWGTACQAREKTKQVDRTKSISGQPNIEVNVKIYAENSKPGSYVFLINNRNLCKGQNLQGESQ